MEQYNNKTDQEIYNHLIRCCKKLIQKCSFKSLSDTSRLCFLVYWLYIYGHKDLVLEICEHTHGVDFVFEYWASGIPNISGLEIRIAREVLGENRRDSIPPNLLDYFFSKIVQKEVRYPQILREEEIASCSERALNLELLYALYNMIGKGETGLYTDLNKNWKKIEQTITEYIDYLKKE